MPASSGPRNGAASLTAGQMRKEMFDFWLSRGLDRFGDDRGFHGTLDGQARPREPTSKTLIQQARHLWALSELLGSGRNSSAAVRAAADGTFAFITSRMATRTNAGPAFVYEVSRDGRTVANAAVNAYANAFAIYGFARYAQVTGSAAARALALSTFKTLDALYHDERHGGYDESDTIGGLVFDSVPLADSPRVAMEQGGAPRGAAAQGRPRLSQSYNTLLHVAEALAELSRATGGGEPLVQARLLELTRLMTGPMLLRSPYAHIAPSYDPAAGWRPAGPAFTSWGHNIEAAWLLDDGLRQLEATRGVGASEAAGMRASLVALGRAAVAAGWDARHGGLFEGGVPGASGTPSRANKVWWVQCEAMLGLDWLAKQTGDASYVDKLRATMAFTQRHLWNAKLGEMWWQVGPAGGAPVAWDASLPADTLGSAWKASYHTGRALLRLEAAGY